MNPTSIFADELRPSVNEMVKAGLPKPQAQALYSHWGRSRLRGEPYDLTDLVSLLLRAKEDQAKRHQALRNEVSRIFADSAAMPGNEVAFEGALTDYSLALIGPDTTTLAERVRDYVHFFGATQNPDGSWKINGSPGKLEEWLDAP